MSTTQALTIVVGYDGADAARRGLGRVREMGDRAARVLVVAVTPDVRSSGTGSQLAGATFDASLLTQEAVDLLGEQPDRQVETRTPSGDPAVVLVALAREVGADLVVVGRRGGDFVTRTLLGSVAERVVSQAPCDVLVVA